MMTLTNTQKILLVLSVITLWLTFTDVGVEDDEMALPTRVLTQVKPGQVNQGDLDLDLHQRSPVALTSDLFDYQAPPVAKPKVNAPVQKPKAFELPKVSKPLPFKYIGLWQEDDVTSVMADYQGNVITFREGSVIAGLYKVISIVRLNDAIDIKFLELKENTFQNMHVTVKQP